MSEREQVQQRLAAWLETWTTAPYGVITNLRLRMDGPGKYRSITFGLAATWDASLTIWSPTRLVLRSVGTTDVTTFTSELAFRQYCAEYFGAPVKE